MMLRTPDSVNAMQISLFMMTIRVETGDQMAYRESSTPSSFFFCHFHFTCYYYYYFAVFLFSPIQLNNAVEQWMCLHYLSNDKERKLQEERKKKQSAENIYCLFYGTWIVGYQNWFYMNSWTVRYVRIDGLRTNAVLLFTSTIES